MKKCFTTKLGVNEGLKVELKVANICKNMHFPFDTVEAERQLKELDERIDWVDTVVHPFIPPRPKQDKTPITKIYKINGDYTKQVEDWRVDEDIEGPFCRIHWEPINLNSDKQVKEWLLKNGWVPTEWNYKKDSRKKDIIDSNGNKIKTSPKITDDSLEQMEELGQAGRLLAYRRKCTHKRNQIAGFFKHLKEDGTVPSKVNTLGAETRRMTHSIIVNVPSPREGQWYKDMRKCFYHGDPDYVVVGCDASQIQVRGLVHYAAEIGDWSGIEAMRKADAGETKDFHSANDEACGGIGRVAAKGVFYGYLFGASLKKTASQLKKSMIETKRIRKTFDEVVPYISKLVNMLTSYYRKNGYITGIDGVPIYVPSEHMLLVYLLQNFEAVFMKVCLCYIHDRVKDKGIRANLCTMQHDELQFVCHKDDAKKLARVMEKSMQDAGKFIGSNCPVYGKAKIGKTWFDTH